MEPMVYAASLRSLFRHSMTKRWAPLDVDRLEEGGQRRFLHRFRHRRMGVAGAGQIFRRAAELHQHRRLMDHLTGAEADDMDAEHAVALLVSQDLHETVGMQYAARAAIGGEGEFADLVVDAGLLQLFLGLA